MLQSLTGGAGADVALVAAGAPNIVDQASACVKKRGQVGFIAMITREIPVYTYCVQRADDVWLDDV